LCGRTRRLRGGARLLSLLLRGLSLLLRLLLRGLPLRLRLLPGELGLLLCLRLEVDGRRPGLRSEQSGLGALLLRLRPQLLRLRLRGLRLRP
jgi:hypothetical protein